MDVGSLGSKNKSQHMLPHVEIRIKPLITETKISRKSTRATLMAMSEQRYNKIVKIKVYLKSL